MTQLPPVEQLGLTGTGLPRLMPDEWQRRFVACLRELDAAFAHVEQAPGYQVDAAEWKYVNELSDAEMKLAGVTLDWNEARQEPVYYDRDGDELDARVGKVAVPASEPLPGYRRLFVRPDLDAVALVRDDPEERTEAARWRDAVALVRQGSGLVDIEAVCARIEQLATEPGGEEPAGD